jgi:hypothetical protein
VVERVVNFFPLDTSTKQVGLSLGCISFLMTVNN